MDSQSSGGDFKRKKKRMSTYQRAMKFSKRGKFGHGFQIQDEDFQYFLNILKVSKETFESDDDKSNYRLLLSTIIIVAPKKYLTLGTVKILNLMSQKYFQVFLWIMYSNNCMEMK